MELLKVLKPNVELQNQGGLVKLVQTAIANISHIVIMSLCCIICNCIFTSLFYHYYELSLSLSLWFIVIKCSILSSISVMLISGISLYRLNKYEASDLLRQEI